ncbi:MAG: hypothetical protein M4579_004002 [Chaenotheca gracillima]|nr:MAG: hypothetical protein M4579_004002 [Chaenotheca gracillima]
MGTKRSHAEMANDTAVHASRKGNIPQSTTGRPQRKQQQPQHKKHNAPWAGPGHDSSRTSMNVLKKKVRDLSRLLEHTHGDDAAPSKAADMPGDVRMENERALATYRQELAEAEVERERQKMIKRYHMVRFFERQKATRRLKKLVALKRKSTDEESAADIESSIHEAEVDLNYTLYSPLYTKYISLYAGAEDAVAEKAGDKPPLWHEVERCMRSGISGALDELRNSSNFTVDGEESPKPFDGAGQGTGQAYGATIPSKSKKKGPGSDRILGGDAVGRREARAHAAPASSFDSKEKTGEKTKTKPPKKGEDRDVGAAPGGAASRTNKPRGYGQGREKKVERENVEDDDDDGGFFEE